MQISKEMTMGEILEVNQGLADVLVESGMHCVGCPAHSFETLEEACAVHGIDVEKMVEDLNAYLNAEETDNK